MPSDDFGIAASARFPIGDTETTTHDLGSVGRAEFVQRTGNVPTAHGLRLFRLALSEKSVVLTYVPPKHFPVGTLTEVVARFPRGMFVGPLTPATVAPLLAGALAHGNVDLTLVSAQVMSVRTFDLPQTPQFDFASFAHTYPHSKYIYCGAWHMELPMGWSSYPVQPTGALLINIAGGLRMGFGDGKFVVQRTEPGGRTVTDWYTIPGLHLVTVGATEPGRTLAIALATANTPLRTVSSAQRAPGIQPNPYDSPWILMGTDVRGKPLAAWVWELHGALHEADAYLAGGISAGQAVTRVQALGYKVRPASVTAPALVDPSHPAWYVPVWHGNGWGYILVDQATGAVTGKPLSIRETAQY